MRLKERVAVFTGKDANHAHILADILHLDNGVGIDAVGGIIGQPGQNGLIVFGQVVNKVILYFLHDGINGIEINIKAAAANPPRRQSCPFKWTALPFLFISMCEYGQI